MILLREIPCTKKSINKNLTLPNVVILWNENSNLQILTTHYGLGTTTLFKAIWRQQ